MTTKRLFVLATVLLATGLLMTAQAPPPAKAQPAKAPPAQAPPAAPQSAAQPTGPERLKGTIVNQGGPLAQFFQAGFFQLQIDRYSTDEEAMALFNALKSGGQDALLKAVWNLKQIGFVKVGGSLGYPIIFARSRQTEAGRIIRTLTNRPIAPAEIKRMSRSTDYPFGVIEIMLPPEGKGEGNLVPTAQVSLTGSGAIAVEAFGNMPVRLLDVAPEETKKK